MSSITKKIDCCQIWRAETIIPATGEDAIPGRVKVTLVGFIDKMTPQEWQAIKRAWAHNKILRKVTIQVQT